MAFDYKKEYREFYLPKNKPEIVDIPEMKFLAVRGKGDPNEEGGAYKAAIGLLYGIAFTIKMSKRSGHKIEGYFDYVVPPLEGFWWQEGCGPAGAEAVQASGAQDDAAVQASGAQDDAAVQVSGVQDDAAVQASGAQDDAAVQVSTAQNAAWEMDYSRKSDLCWISVIRLPDFVTEEEFRWAIREAEQKKQQDYSAVEFLTLREGLCVQCMHVGPYDDEPATVAQMDEFLRENGYVNDFSASRLHHEIYLSDARRVAPERRKTVIRHPVRRCGKR